MVWWPTSKIILCLGRSSHFFYLQYTVELNPYITGPGDRKTFSNSQKTRNLNLFLDRNPGIYFSITLGNHPYFCCTLALWLIITSS